MDNWLKLWIPIFVVSIISITVISISAEESLIPSWIKNTAQFWVEDQVSDSEFINALQFMITNGIIQIPTQSDEGLKELQDENEQLKDEIASLKSQLSGQTKIDFKEYYSEGYGVSVNIPDGWYEEKFHERCILFISEIPKGAGSTLCVVLSPSVTLEIRQEFLDKIFQEKFDLCRDPYKELDYSCDGFTTRKLEQITMAETPAYLFSYSEQRWPLTGGTKITHTLWVIILPYQFETTFFTLETTRGDVSQYDEIMDEIISSFKFVRES